MLGTRPEGALVPPLTETRPRLGRRLPDMLGAPETVRNVLVLLLGQLVDALQLGKDKLPALRVGFLQKRVLLLGKPRVQFFRLHDFDRNLWWWFLEGRWFFGW